MIHVAASHGIAQRSRVTPPSDKRSVGAAAEEHARRHLEAHGMTTLTRNYRTRGGEIDLIMRDGDMLVFVEVRYRQGRGYGDGIDSVDRNKQAKLIRTAQHYLMTHHPRSMPPCRFDVVAVSDDVNAPTLDWIRNALQGF